MIQDPSSKFNSLADVQNSKFKVQSLRFKVSRFKVQSPSWEVLD